MEETCEPRSVSSFLHTTLGTCLSWKKTSGSHLSVQLCHTHTHTLQLEGSRCYIFNSQSAPTFCGSIATVAAPERGVCQLITHTHQQRVGQLRGRIVSFLLLLHETMNTVCVTRWEKSLRLISGVFSFCFIALRLLILSS